MGRIVRDLVKSVNRKALIFMMIIFLYYFVTRLYGISGHMNEYFDYDEGTYLMIARLINQGYLPYRDIFAVHPPLFYYMLALWLRIFGDNYVVGRLLSVFLGFLSLIVAYYVGKEVKDWKLGVAFAGLLAMDPLLIHVNPLVFHESSIELFTLLSLYYFVKYAKTKNFKYAYISLFWAGIGSTSKFTILPFAIALYLTIFFSFTQEIFEYFKNASKVILNKKQVFIGLMSYILITLISMSAIFLWPTELVRKLMIVPGLHKIEVYGQIIPSAFLLAIWGMLTIYIFDVSYVRKILEICIFVIKNIKTALLLGLSLLFPKIIIEGFLGILVSRDYIYQTYLLQGSRLFSIINLFMYIGDKFSYIHKNSLEFLMANTVMFLMVFTIFLAWMLHLECSRTEIRNWLKSLFIMNFFVYFFVSPIVPNDRFLISMWLVLYLTSLEVVQSIKFNKTLLKKLVAISAIFLLITDFGVMYQYPQGKLNLIWAHHSKEMRDELKEYMIKNNLTNGKFYAVNPMNTYYLNLKINPWYLDTFGLVLLKRMNATQILGNLTNVKYYILSTWSYFWWTDILRKQMRMLTIEIVTSNQLLYSDSFKNGEILELFCSLDNPDKKLSLSTYKGTLQLWVDNSTIASIHVIRGNTSYNYRTKIILVDERKYKVTQYSNDTNKVEFELYLNNTSITLKFSEENSVMLEFFRDVIVLDENKLITTNEIIDIESVDVYSSNIHFKIDGKFELTKRNDRTLEIKGRKIKITIINE
ncbi:MAG: glycosyltransferase family 39 protein [Thermococcus sp.]|uniref:ArnT family glycosyltransferase n=1 Tax=Thermococcus sp. TaxID=35749 RepID=UPI001D5809D7|nr:glycosyltransferase family 39 protein [Thermococcus sp.]MBO8174829.1 glycosyltransferase family 39 protein [Thermococcus sp.]